MFRILSLVYVCITNVFAARGLLEHWKCSSQNNGETVCQEICGGCQARPHYQGHAKNGSRSVFKVRTYLIFYLRKSQTKPVQKITCAHCTTDIMDPFELLPLGLAFYKPPI